MHHGNYILSLRPFYPTLVTAGYYPDRGLVGVCLVTCVVSTKYACLLGNHPRSPHSVSKDGSAAPGTTHTAVSIFTFRCSASSPKRNGEPSHYNVSRARVVTGSPGGDGLYRGGDDERVAVGRDGRRTKSKNEKVARACRAVRLRLPLALGGRDGSCRKCNVRSKRDLDSPQCATQVRVRISERTACRRAPCDGPCPIDGHGGRGHNSQDTTVNTYRLRVLAVLCGVRFRRARHNHISTVQLDNSRVRPRWSIGI